MRCKMRRTPLIIGVAVLMMQFASVPVASAQTHRISGDVWTEADSGRIVRASSALVYLWPNDTVVTKVINSACVASKADMTSWMVARQALNDTDPVFPVSAVVARDLALLRSIAQLPHAMVTTDSVGHFVFDSIPNGNYWIEAEAMRDGKFIQWWKTTTLMTFPFHVRGVDPSTLSDRLGPLELHESQFCTAPEPRVGAAAFVNDTPLIPTDRIYDTRELDKNVQIIYKGDPIRYPEAMRKTGIAADGVLSFVVNQDGRAEMSSIRVIRYAGPDFIDAAKHALATMQFAPAEVHGKPVRSRVIQEFNFTVTQP